MRKNKILLIFLSIILIVFSALGYLYIFNIYEVMYSVEPDKMFADNQSTLVIEAIPINALGWRTPFRIVNATYKITEGQELVTIIKTNFANGMIELKTNKKAGNVSIKAFSSKALLPSSIDFIIHPVKR